MRNDATFFVFAGFRLLSILAGKTVHSLLPNPWGTIESAEEE